METYGQYKTTLDRETLKGFDYEIEKPKKEEKLIKTDYKNIKSDLDNLLKELEKDYSNGFETTKIDIIYKKLSKIRGLLND